jgi:hypothetical protein
MVDSFVEAVYLKKKYLFLLIQPLVKTVGSFVATFERGNRRKRLAWGNIEENWNCIVAKFAVFSQQVNKSAKRKLKLVQLCEVDDLEKH